MRDTSSPFDWCTSSLKGVLDAIEDNFADMFNPEYLSQRTTSHEIYKNLKYNITFFHDFDGFVPLEEQIGQVEEKYHRRIDRFYKNISEPTLFIRYINNAGEKGRPDELVWIEENYDYIIRLIKSFNPENDIIFIASKGYACSEKVDLILVEPDSDATVARTFADSDKAVREMLTGFEYAEREKNLEIYNRKNLRNKLHKEISRRKNSLKRKFVKPYIHHNQYRP